MSTATAAISCPECESDVTVADGIRQNEIVECAACMSELEVVTVEPLLLAVAPEVEEDWGE
ncbi:lysine biosynthesis protein LysW [Streptomyces triticagri]|uniref:Lysine biosynthesis protein LysW n=1 Tax=Streptomyces triticagri TaxID=2293568 RepID=A0A372LXM8_9ACTN|nr:lysine biosynthesis protein LysW [Streptomyces triticagri]RFU83418.1 lysine biosynthesis protein LysW [Streptomyces triticagri]